MRNHIETNTTNLESSMSSPGDGTSSLDNYRVRPGNDLRIGQESNLRDAHENGALNSPINDYSKDKEQLDNSSIKLDQVANRSYSQPTRNSISLNGIETSVSELRGLAKEAGFYDPKIGPRENSMVITQDGSKFKSLSISAGGDSQGNKNFLSGALMQMYVAKFPWYMTKGKSHGVGLEVHTHQTDIPKTDPYVFSYPDILNGQGKNWPQIVATDDGCILFKQAGSKSQIPEGNFDSKGGFHKTVRNPDGTYSTELKTSDCNRVECLAK